MSAATIAKLPMPARLKPRQVVLVASGDLRDSANRACWPAQREMEAALAQAVEQCGYELVRGHAVDEQAGHGFLASQKQGMRAFAALDPKAPLIVAEAVWQYSHHVLAGLISHRGPILTVANWSGHWPGLVGMLNLNGSLTKANVEYSTLWEEDFADAGFVRKLDKWLKTGAVRHKLDHVQPLGDIKLPKAERKLGEALAERQMREKAILGVFDEGCMGMFNAIIPDDLLHATGVFKERLSQSALCYETMQVSDEESQAVFDWIVKAGMKFNFGRNQETELTPAQVMLQCKMYVAALRMADAFGCDAIGIQYQQGLKDCLPASDLVEGMLNDSVRPPVRRAARQEPRPPMAGAEARPTGCVLYEGQPLPHFNEVDECAGLDGLMTFRVHQALGQPVENTLHDLRWGDWDRSGTTKEYVWVFEISGSVPPSHLVGGWAGAVGERQPPMYFRLGGSTIKGVSRPGEIVWSRIYIARDRLNMDIGRAEVVELPREETERRWQSTTSQWPIMHAVLYGVTRDQMMARHKANHIQVAYANSAAEADKCLYAKAAMARALGMRVSVCGTRKNGKNW